MTHFFRRNIKRTLIGIFGVTLLVGGLTACGHRPHDYGASMTAEQYAQKRDKMVDRVASKLDLNEDQKKRLTTLGDKLYEQRTALVGQTKDPRAEMKALVAGDKFDTARAQTLINDKTAALQTKSPEVIAALADFYNSLNPTQQQKVRDYMEGRGRWFRHG
jgi:Spy/CpxP family protein refolding chaperone